MPENDTEETEEETAVPSWVKRILGSIAPVADVPASETVKQDLEKSSEPVTPLITDLPEEIPHSGILSDDENIELMEWLKDTDLEIQESKGELIKETEEGVQPELTSFISESESELLPTLELESEEALDLEPASGLTKDVEMFDRSIEQVLDLDQEPASLAEIVVKQEEPAEVNNELMDPLRLVDENNFADLENYLDENRLDADHSALLVEKINQKLSLAPDTFEMWQSLGDVLVNNSKFMDALEAYKTAEKILLNK
jgi:hypothetical protein